MSVYSLALSDAGKTKIAIRFDEGDGILKYYKEFGSICCHLKGPPSTSMKVSLLDNTMKEICGATDSGVLAISNHDGIRTDSKGDSTFNCIVNKGCQAYDSMFFVIAVCWDTDDEGSTMISAPFVSGSKGPAEAMNDKNRFRPQFVSFTSLKSFRVHSYFNCENKMQKDSSRITLQLFEGRELRMFSGQPSSSMFSRNPEAFYYKAKTRSQSHKLDVAEKMDPGDLDAKIREKLNTTAVGLVQLLVKSCQKNQISEKESEVIAAGIPNLFNELFQTEFYNQNQNASVTSDSLFPNKRSPKPKTPVSTLAITPLAKAAFKLEKESNNKNHGGQTSSSSGSSNAAVSGSKRNRTHLIDTDEWQSSVNDPLPVPAATASRRNSFPRPKHHGSSSGSSASSGTAKDNKSDATDFDDPRSPFYYAGSRTGTITGIAAAGGADELGDEEQFMNSQNSLLTSGGGVGGMFSRTGSINPHAFDDDTGDVNAGASAAGCAANGGGRGYNLRANSLRKGSTKLNKGFSIDSHFLDELAASGQNFDSMVSNRGLTDSQEVLLASITRTNTEVVNGEDCDMLFDSNDLLSRSNTLNKDGGAVGGGGSGADTVAAAAIAILEENRNKGINMLITAIDKKAAHNAREGDNADTANVPGTTTTSTSSVGAREASVSVNNTQESDSPIAMNVVQAGGEQAVTAQLHDSFVGDWMLTQSQ